MEKKAVGKQTGGFIQQRKGTRPYRVETLLGRGNDKRPSDLVETYEPQQPSPERQFEGSLVGMVSDEFKKHSALEGMIEGPSPVVGAIGDAVARHATQEKVRGRSQSARADRRPEVEPHRPYVDAVKTAESVYHYAPKGVDLIAEGLKTPATLDDPQAWAKYRGRVAGDVGKPEGKVTREEVLQWLEKSRGPGGSRMASVLHQPIGESARAAQRDYAIRRQLYKIDLDRARREGAVEGAHVVEESPRSQRQVQRRRLVSELKKAKGFDSDDPRLLFKGTPHGFLTIREGTLPGRYLSKQAEDLYHGSPKRLKVLRASREHGDPRVPDAVFATPSRPFALSYSGRKWSDRDIGQGMYYDKGTAVPREMYLREMRPGAFEDTYRGKKGYLYTLPSEGFEPPTGAFGRKGSAMELIRQSSVTPTKVEEIEDVYEALRNEPIVKLYEYNPKDPKVRTSIRRSVRRMKMMKPEDAAQYRRWRLEGAPPEIKRIFQEELQKTGAAPEFAPGIPANRAIKSIPRVPEKGANKEWTVSLSKHPAARRGDHHDMRLVDPRGQAHSWAFNELPEPGKGTYAAQQPTHSGKYARRKKPFSIPLGVYGGTRPGAKVEPLYVQPTEVISSSNDRVHFLRHHGQQTDEFVLKRLSKPVAGSSQSPMWAMRNTTRNRSTAEGKRLPDFKPRYKDTDPDQIDLTDREQVLTPKIDGAHTLVDFPKADKMMRVYSYRPTQRATGVIEHTFKFPNFQKRLVPRDLQGTIIRAETWASDREGRAIPASKLGGLLNSSVPKSRAKQQDEGLKLRMTGIDVVRHKGKDYSNKPYAEKLDIIRKVTKLMRGVVEPPMVAHTPEQKKMLLSAVKTGKLPETKEGVVVHELNKDAPFQRAKIRPDHDVYVRRIDTKKSSPAGQASGFSYSFEPDGKIMGRVGTGLSRTLRHDMAANPEKYIGRVAKVQSAGRHQKRKDPSQGALVGSPAFKEWHIDKTPPELLKEGEFVEALGGQLGGLAEKIDPENLIAGYVGGRGKGLKLLKVRPVEVKIQQLREAYHKAVGKRDKK